MKSLGFFAICIFLEHILHPGYALTHSEKLSNFSTFSTKKERFSRARFQFAENLSHDLNDHWAVEASARAFVDPGVWSANYLDSVTSDERWEANLRSLSLEFHHLPWKVRLGLQQIVWGEALHYFSADLLHPKDLRDFFLNDLEWARIPQAGVYLSYDNGQQSFQFVYFPYSAVHRFPKAGSEFFLRRYSAEPWSAPNPPRESIYDFSKPTIGVNYGARIKNLDLHMIGVFSKDFQRYFDGREFKNDRLFTTALTASYTYDDFLFRNEEILYFNRRVNIAPSIFSLSDDFVNQLSSLPSIEYTLSDDLTFSQQMFWQETLNCNPAQVSPCRTIQHGTGILWTHLPFKLELDTTAWIEYKDPSAWWSVKIKRPFGDHLNASVGTEQFFGEGSTAYSELSSHDQITLRLDYTF